jgi:hypothetical protein
MSETIDSALKAVQKMLDEKLQSEVIGGVKLADVIDCIELDIADSPVMPFAHDTTSGYIPEVVETRKTIGGSYILMHDAFTSPVSADSLKVMRGRFLLWRDHYYKRLQQRSLSYPQQQEVVAKFFGGSVWVAPNQEAQP